MEKIWLRFWLIIFLLVVIIFLSVGESNWFSFANENSHNLQVTFLDVGQGDAILITTPTGVQVLIDGGPDASVIRQLGKYIRPWDRQIDLVVATHPDKDHIAGLVDVLKRYQVETILTTENRGETLTATALQSAILAETGANIIYARTGEILNLDASTSLAVFSPANNPANLESNSASIVLQLRYGEIEFMLTGDAPAGIEEYLVKTYGPSLLASEVLKLGHHGSNTASSQAWLRAVSPLYAVVSAGLNNSYGHPNPEVVARVEAAGAKIVSTANSGSINFITDGQQLWLEKK